MKPKLKVVPSINNGALEKLPTGAPQFLTVPEVAALLRCRPSTIYQLVHKRRIPFRKAGRQVLFEVSEIDEWTKKSAERQ